MAFEVYRADGTKVNPGDEMTDFRGDTAKFLGCKHPSKIMTDRMGCEKYPSVFDVEIRGVAGTDDEGWIRNPMSEEGKRLAAAMAEETQEV